MRRLPAAERVSRCADGPAGGLPAPLARARRAGGGASALGRYGCRGRVWLERRPPRGIWGGMWCLPECPPDAAPVDWCMQRFGTRPDRCIALPEMRHVLTHRRLRIQPWRLELPQAVAEPRSAWACGIRSVRRRPGAWCGRSWIFWHNGPRRRHPGRRRPCLIGPPKPCEEAGVTDHFRERAEQGLSVRIAGAARYPPRHRPRGNLRPVGAKRRRQDDAHQHHLRHRHGQRRPRAGGRPRQPWRLPRRACPYWPRAAGTVHRCLRERLGDGQLQSRPVRQAARSGASRAGAARSLALGQAQRPHHDALRRHEAARDDRQGAVARAGGAVFDEPTAGVDVELRRDMWALVRGCGSGA